MKVSCLHASVALSPGKGFSVPIGWVGLRAGLDVVEQRKMSCPCRESNPGHPARRYPGSLGCRVRSMNSATVDPLEGMVSLRSADRCGEESVPPRVQYIV
jgi:hypothetical protein